MRLKTKETLQQFSHMSNAEAYVEAFHNRLMRPLPDTARTGEYWGSTTRADFYPFLRQTLALLSADREINLLDVGAGSGEMVDHVLKDYPAVVSAIEPNPLMLKSYMQAVDRNPCLHLNAAYPHRIQSLYHGQSGEHWLQELPQQDFVLASHMVYGLSCATSSSSVNPRRDLTNFLSAMYESLADDGVLFLVYAVGENVLFGEAAAHYIGKSMPECERNVRAIWESRTDLLENAGAKALLDARFPNHSCQVSTVRTNSFVYGDTLDDIAAYCILGELTQFDNEPFDLNKLRHHFDFVKRHGRHFHMHEMVGGPRDGMLAVPTPQIICKLQKSRTE